VLDTIGGRNLGFGDDVPYVESAWEQVERGDEPVGDDIAGAFYHLARVEERDSTSLRDRHGRFLASASCLDPLDPPVERLRRRLGLEPPRWGGARFAVALTHDIDTPWRWTRGGIRAAGRRLRDHASAGQARPALAEARGLAAVPLHRLRNTDPNWCFGRIRQIARTRGAASTFYVMAGHHHPADGGPAETYDCLRHRLVETITAAGGEIGLHGSYLAAEQQPFLAEEKRRLEELAGPLRGHRFHYLRVDPHRNLSWLDQLGFAYDTSLGFPDRPGFRAGIAHAFRPWDFASDRPLDIIEVPLAAMDATLAEDRYLGLSAEQAEPQLLALLRQASENGGAFAVLWHNDRFDPATARGWDRLFMRFIEAVRQHGGVCVSAAALAEETAAWLS